MLRRSRRFIPYQGVFETMIDSLRILTDGLLAIAFFFAAGISEDRRPPKVLGSPTVVLGPSGGDKVTIASNRFCRVKN